MKIKNHSSIIMDRDTMNKAQQGYIEYQCDLAKYYEEQKEWDKALYWWKKAAEFPYAIAAKRVALIYFQKQPRQDFFQAYLWFRKAVEYGYEESRLQKYLMPLRVFNNLIRFYIEQTGSEKKLNEWISWVETQIVDHIQIGLDTNFMTYSWDMEDLFDIGKMFRFQKDKTEIAKKCFYYITKQHDVSPDLMGRTWFQLGRIMDHNTEYSDFEYPEQDQAYQYYLKAAQQYNSAEAFNILGFIAAEEGKYNQALEYYKKAAEMGNYRSCFNLIDTHQEHPEHMTFEQVQSVIHPFVQKWGILHYSIADFIGDTETAAKMGSPSAQKQMAQKEKEKNNNIQHDNWLYVGRNTNNDDDDDDNGNDDGVGVGDNDDDDYGDDK